MAAVVGKKLVENGQERISQRIHDGLTPNMSMDVSNRRAEDLFSRNAVQKSQDRLRPTHNFNRFQCFGYGL